jgi:DnaJ-class molecular chaperone
MSIIDDIKRGINILKAVRTGKRLCRACDGIGRPPIRTPKGLIRPPPKCTTCSGSGVVDE